MTKAFDIKVKINNANDGTLFLFFKEIEAKMLTITDRRIDVQTNGQSCS